VEWTLRSAGAHLHPGREEATVELAGRAAHYGFPTGGRVLEVASALGGPARFIARRFSATVVGVDMNPMMHALARATDRAEGLALRCQPVLARTECLPFAGDSFDAAWSQDALCHMDKPPVVSEVARTLRPGCIFAFTDWIARAPLTAEDWRPLARLWGFPSLLRLAEYVALLDASGFDVLLAEDRTAALTAQRAAPPDDQDLWLHWFAQRWGEAEVRRQREPGEAWQALVAAGRTGYGMFVCKRHPG